MAEPTSISFDPSVHLAYQEPASRFSMKELGLDEVGAASEVGVTAPFQLCSPAGIAAMRADILSPPVIKGYSSHSGLAGPHCQLRGMAPKAAKFVYDFWTHPETLAAVSAAAGEDLVPVFNYELGHVNIQVKKGSTREETLRNLKADPFAQVERPPSPPMDDGADDLSKSADSAVSTPTNDLVVGWHCDAYPWVCVVMLSDVTHMKGGETAILKGDGSIARVIGPQLGSAVMMQGGYIKHAAMPCSGASERLTMVTSFRPKKANYKDVSNLTNIIDCSRWYELYDQWIHSRLELLQDKVAAYQTELKERRARIEAESDEGGLLHKPTVDLDEFDAFRADLVDLLCRASSEMKPYSHPSNIWSQ